MGRPPGWRKLASLPVGGGREACIWLDEDGETQTTPGMSGAFAAFGDNPFVAEVPDGTVAFGDLPAGSVDVRVRAPAEPTGVVVAGGSFLALLPCTADGSDVFVAGLDADGAVVPRELPEVLERKPVEDADVPCPACGATTWDEVEVRAEPDFGWTRMSATACRTCAWHDGWSSAGRRRPGHEHPAHPVPEERAWTPADVVRAAAAPVYAIDPSFRGRRELATWSWEEDGSVRSVGVNHRLRAGRRRSDVVVESAAIELPQHWDARTAAVERLAHRLEDDDDDRSGSGLSERARSLRHEDQRRRSSARARSRRCRRSSCPSRAPA